MHTRLRYLLFVVLICLGAGCANITTPTGGRKDKTPPKLVEITPADSLLNTRVKRLEMYFDEYITVSDASKEVQISPIIAIQPAVSGLNKRVVVKIVDTLLEDNTTYRISFGKAIKDLHEGNPFKPYTYTFSTGSYFDSMMLKGNIINAATGFPDANTVTVELYSANDKDSAVIKHKPRYVTKTDSKGDFMFKGLPGRKYRIYAIRDSNNNLTYDGPIQSELIGFRDSLATPYAPHDTSVASINMRIFPELPDTAAQKRLDSLAKKEKLKSKSSRMNAKDSTFSYAVNIDTGNRDKRTFDINGFIKITFNKIPVLVKEKIKLTYDSLDNNVVPETELIIDSTHPKELYIKTSWELGTVYTLRLPKGFAKDTSGKEAPPAKMIFRTNNDDDYGKIKVNLQSKYGGGGHVLLITSDKDTVYYKPVKDTVISVARLKPTKYTLRIIVDKNHDGRWNTGDLFARLQPEIVIPYSEPVTIKAGWENVVDFEQKPKPKMMKDKRDSK